MNKSTMILGVAVLIALLLAAYSSLAPSGPPSPKDICIQRGGIWFEGEGGVGVAIPHFTDLANSPIQSEAECRVLGGTCGGYTRVISSVSIGYCRDVPTGSDTLTECWIPDVREDKCLLPPQVTGGHRTTP